MTFISEMTLITDAFLKFLPSVIRIRGCISFLFQISPYFIWTWPHRPFLVTRTEKCRNLRAKSPFCGLNLCPRAKSVIWRTCSFKSAMMSATEFKNDTPSSTIISKYIPKKNSTGEVRQKSSQTSRNGLETRCRILISNGEETLAKMACRLKSCFQTLWW